MRFAASLWLQIIMSGQEMKPLTVVLVLVLSSQLLGNVLLLQVQDALLFLFEPAETSSPKCRVLLHQLLDSDLWLQGGVTSLAPVFRQRLIFFTVGVIVLFT